MFRFENAFFAAFSFLFIAFVLFAFASVKGQTQTDDESLSSVLIDKEKSETIDDWFNQVTDPSVYKKWIRPNTGHGPVRINVSLHFYTVSILDEVTAVSWLWCTAYPFFHFWLFNFAKGIFGSTVASIEMGRPSTQDKQLCRRNYGRKRFLFKSHLDAFTARA